MAQPIWITTQGSIGSYPAQTAILIQLVAQPVFPAISVTYAVISGTLPQGLSLSAAGTISGIPTLVTSDTSYTFVIRATDNLSNIRDRTFSMIISGVASPMFTTPNGNILTEEDSTWIEYSIEYTNPIPDNEVTIRVIQGQLPPGLEINSTGLIRGYAEPPIVNENLASVTTSITSVNSSVITGISTEGFIIGRPIIFSGTSFGGIVAGQTYYVENIIDGLSFTISLSARGSIVSLTNGVGYMTVLLPSIAVGQPTKQTYSFTLKLESLLGTDLESYNIEITNQNLPSSEGGPGLPANFRPPTIYNTRPPTYLITQDTPYFGYYVLPPDSQGFTYSPTENAFIGKITSDNEFSFKIIGKDFDDNVLVYSFVNLPTGLTGDANTGWITGNPMIADDSISEFSFTVTVIKASNPSITSGEFKFSFVVRNDIEGDIVWITPANLGQIENSSISTLSLVAESDVALEYRIINGSLPPNLILTSDGNISGTVAYQPTNTLLGENDTTTFTFTVQAFSPAFSTVVQSTKTFTLTVTQEYVQPTDTLYIKCAPSIKDRNLIRTLLSEQLIPNEYLYRPEDSNFGKATDVIYVHAYGIHANDLDAYIAAITKNHYWRNITLGEINTAVAKNDQGEIIYEVVYSSVIDNLINPVGVSVSKEITWPRFINLNLGPWYTSVSNLYTSYIGASTQGYSLLTESINNILTEDLFIIETESGLPAYYTSLLPGSARTLYPNSLPNMREQVGDELGQEYNFRLYPKWMTSQQRNGSTLGFTPAWVIAYCKPGMLVTTDTINSGLLIIGQMYTIKSIGTTDFTEIGAASNTVGLTFTATNSGTGTGTAYLTTGMTYAAFSNTGLNRSDYKSYAEQLQFNIQNGWKNPVGYVNTLNTINFKIDRFTVDKSLTYNYDNNLSPATWTGLPSATPVPDPSDSKDFFVLFPRETILPDETQY